MKMANPGENDLIEKVRRALGRSAPLDAAPAPPVLNEPITRLVHSDIRLADLFAKTAQSSKFILQQTGPDELTEKLTEFLKSRNCRRVGLSAGGLCQSMNVAPALRDRGFDAISWTDLTLDAAYDLDCGITDVWAAVAETGSLVIRADANQGRALSLVPPIHVAIVEPKNILADLVDLFEKMSQTTPPPAVSIITGPSQTADIEAVMVTGVHGPGIVAVFLIQ
jgi:L-lactate dehydrogenase complex protein LldG